MGSAALSLCVNKNNSSLCPTRLHGDDSCLRQGPGKKGVSRDRDDKDRFMGSSSFLSHTLLAAVECGHLGKPVMMYLEKNLVLS